MLKSFPEYAMGLLIAAGIGITAISFVAALVEVFA